MVNPLLWIVVMATATKADALDWLINTKTASRLQSKRKGIEATCAIIDENYLCQVFLEELNF